MCPLTVFRRVTSWNFKILNFLFNINLNLIFADGKKTLDLWWLVVERKGVRFGTGEELLVKQILGVFRLVVSKVILGSSGALVLKLPVTIKRMGVGQSDWILVLGCTSAFMSYIWPFSVQGPTGVILCTFDNATYLKNGWLYNQTD